MGARVMARAASQQSMLPARIGRYELVTLLGEGGLASVYLARGTGAAGFARLAAVKLLHAALCNDREVVAMFLDEARVASRLHHPNTAAIIDVGSEGARPFMVMDYVEGDTLATVQRAAMSLHRDVPLGIVLRVVLDALAGLDAAHELRGPDGEDLGLVHRAATPQNILLGVDGSSRIVDFGFARAALHASARGNTAVRGGFPFMAPEQVHGRPVDRRADVFSMGVTLWETLALRRCLPSRSAAVLKDAAADDYRSLEDFAPHVPAALDAFCRRALARNPDDRFPTAAAFGDAIERAFGHHIATRREVGQFIALVARDKLQRERDAVRRTVRPGELPGHAASVRPPAGFDLRAPRVPDLASMGLRAATGSDSLEDFDGETRQMPSRRPSSGVFATGRLAARLGADAPVQTPEPPARTPLNPVVTGTVIFELKRREKPGATVPVPPVPVTAVPRTATMPAPPLASLLPLSPLELPPIVLAPPVLPPPTDASWDALRTDRDRSDPLVDAVVRDRRGRARAMGVALAVAVAACAVAALSGLAPRTFERVVDTFALPAAP